MRITNPILFFLLILKSLSLISQPLSELEKQAKAEFTNKKYYSALPLYKKIIKENPGNIPARFNLVSCLFQTEDYKNCIAECDQALKLKLIVDEKYHFIAYKAHSAYRLEQWEEAVRGFNSYLLVNYEYYPYYLLRGVAFLKLDSFEKAIRDIKTSLLDPKFPKANRTFAYSKMGFSYIELNNYEEAKEYSVKCQLIDSNDAYSLVLSSYLLYYKDEYTAAIGSYTKLLKCTDAWVNGVVYWYRGFSYSRIKRYPEAIDDFSKYIRLVDSTDSNLHNEMSWTCFLTNDYTRALRHANKAIALDSANLDAIDTRGSIYYKLGKYQNAIEDFKHTIKLNPDYVNSYYYRGLSYLKINKKNLACSDFEKVLSYKEYKINEGELPVIDLIKQNCKK